MIRVPPGAVVVLDLDDTLYAEREYQHSGFRAVARVAVGDDWPELYQQMVDSTDPLLVASEASHLPVAQLLHVHRTHEPELTLYPDAERLLDRLTRPAILTDGRSITQRNKIAALGIAGRVGPVFISEETGVSKPHEDAFLNVTTGLPACYIADNPRKDFVAARRLGWTTIMLIDRGANVHAQDVDLPEGYRPDFRVESLDEIDVGR